MDLINIVALQSLLNITNNSTSWGWCSAFSPAHPYWPFLSVCLFFGENYGLLIAFTHAPTYGVYVYYVVPIILLCVSEFNKNTKSWSCASSTPSCLSVCLSASPLPVLLVLRLLHSILSVCLSVCLPHLSLCCWPCASCTFTPPHLSLCCWISCCSSWCLSRRA